MLASRRHISLQKSIQPSRETSTLKHSSNQKGLRVRNEKRKAAAAAASNVSVTIQTGVQSGGAELAGCEWSGSFVARAIEGGMSRRVKGAIPNDIMLTIAQILVDQILAGYSPWLALAQCM
jgi:hypothetical protein